MTIQYIIDRAQQIEIDRKKMIGQTISRSQRIKTSERSTAQPWKWRVTPPGALKWSDSRGIIEVIDLNDRSTEYEISLNNNSNMSYITAYQGELTTAQRNSITISSTSTQTITLGSLPAIGATLSSRTYMATAKSFAAGTSATYNRAFSTARTDFLITNAEYNSNFANIKVGDALSTTTYVTSGQTIASVTYNYITLANVGYTRIVMSAAADANSAQAATNGAEDIDIQTSKTVLVSSSTYVLKKGDLIQPANSRYPYSVTADVQRGSGSTVVVNLHREFITSEGVNVVGQTVKFGNSVTWRVIVSALPTYKLIPNQLVQYTGDFELFEKII